MTAALLAGVGTVGAVTVSAATASGHAESAAPQAHTASGIAVRHDTPTSVPTTGASPTDATQMGAAQMGAAQMGAAQIGGAAAPVISRITPAAAAVRLKERPPPVVRWVSPLPEGTVTSCYGQRWGRLHAGVDIAAADRTPIHAAGAGVVVAAGEAEGYGIAVLIDHGNGYLTHYGHMSAVTVAEGDRVEPGTPVGYEGSTGHSTGPHLHFEVHRGAYKNPIEPTAWMREHGVDIPGCTTADE
ncbi:M23 family metallopeptidase [Mangrovihabitans endophyticus]|nr:M23 family metallopeptidase [Mangrovihabitans endophyticus]